MMIPAICALDHTLTQLPDSTAVHVAAANMTIPGGEVCNLRSSLGSPYHIP